MPKAGAPNTAVERPQVDPASERRAASSLADRARAQNMKDADLRQRLEVTRSLLAQGNLSPAQQAELRRRLAADRDVLRQRVTQEEVDQSRRPNAGQGPSRSIRGGGAAASRTLARR